MATAHSKYSMTTLMFSTCPSIAMTMGPFSRVLDALKRLVRGQGWVSTSTLLSRGQLTSKELQVSEVIVAVLMKMFSSDAGSCKGVSWKDLN